MGGGGGWREGQDSKLCLLIGFPLMFMYASNTPNRAQEGENLLKDNFSKFLD